MQQKNTLSKNRTFSQAQVHGKEHFFLSPHISIARETGPMDILKGKQVLVIADDENLHISAKDLGGRVSYQTLTQKINKVTKSCSYHACFSRIPGDKRRVLYFLSRGWMPHPRDIEVVYTREGRKKDANSDNLISFMAGALVSRTKAQVIVVASGDGTLVSDIARAIQSLPKQRQVVTLSLAGSTAWRLNASENKYITSNIEIGLDCLHFPVRPVR